MVQSNREFVLASNNAGKIKEFEALFSTLYIKIYPQKYFNIEEVEETGLSFIENAILKARHASKYANLPAIADDSGIVVPYLKGAPGIYSARYSESKTDEDNNQLLLNNLKGVLNSDREAFFISVLAFVNHSDDPTPLIAEGRIYGTILEEPRGEEGFGYDPLFYLKDYDKSMAEISLNLKNEISHRAKAIVVMKELLEKTI